MLISETGTHQQAVDIVKKESKLYHVPATLQPKVSYSLPAHRRYQDEAERSRQRETRSFEEANKDPVVKKPLDRVLLDGTPSEYKEAIASSHADLLNDYIVRCTF